MSDMELVRSSGFLQLPIHRQSDIVLADKGFVNMEADFGEAGFNLCMPALKTEAQLPPGLMEAARHGFWHLSESGICQTPSGLQGRQWNDRQDCSCDCRPRKPEEVHHCVNLVVVLGYFRQVSSKLLFFLRY